MPKKALKNGLDELSRNRSNSSPGNSNFEKKKWMSFPEIGVPHAPEICLYYRPYKDLTVVS